MSIDPRPLTFRGDGLDWITPNAVCRQTDPEIFFPYPLGGLEENRMAVRICRRCPLQTPCATYAMERPEIQGIWGGLTDKDRRRARSARKVSAPVVPAQRQPPITRTSRKMPAHEI